MGVRAERPDDRIEARIEARVGARGEIRREARGEVRRGAAARRMVAGQMRKAFAGHGAAAAWAEADRIGVDKKVQAEWAELAVDRIAVPGEIRSGAAARRLAPWQGCGAIAAR